MAYIDADYYNNEFKGVNVPEEDFDRLAQTASDIIDSVVYFPVKEVTDRIKRATAYQIEMLFNQGGLDAVTGNAPASIGSESLGDYSVWGGTKMASSRNGTDTILMNGIPVSALAIALLRQEGLMSRWAYAGRRVYE